jgi:acyl-coenzyme A synthetase/AMP-(fatty) acid ligase
VPASQLPEVDGALEAVRLLTSGSTGRPNPHGKRWATLTVNIGAEAQRLAEHLGRADLRGLTVVATVPAQHSYGLESSVLLAMLGGAVFDAGRPFYPADVADALARVPVPRALVTTPFHLKTVIEAGVPLPPAELVVSATAPLSPQLAAAAESAFGGSLLEIYGCTEAGQVATRRTTASEVWTTFGALRLSRGEPEPGSDLGSARGEGPAIVAGGHVEQPTPLADVIELLDDRRFRLLGRSNDLIHVGGRRSSLGHLNHHLNRVPGVRDGAFWMPDDVAGVVTRPVAFVVAPGLSAQQVVDGLRGQVEDVFLPRRVVAVEALPREATGKLTVGALRAFALQHLAAAAPAAPPAVGSGGSTRVDVAADHPSFAGHFPGQPILPGVVLLSYVLRAVAGDPAARAVVGDSPGVDAVKFLLPVRPGAVLAIALSAAPTGVAFEVRDASGAPVARGRVTATATELGVGQGRA